MKSKSKRKIEFRKKIKEYAIFLKNDHDWDYAYILDLLRYKLERTRKCIRSNNLIKEAKIVCKQIGEVEILLKHVSEDNYYEAISKEFHKKYGHPKIIWGKKDKKTKSISSKFLYQKETPRNSNAIRRQSIKLHRKADKMRQRDLNKAFSLMSKNIWGWWD